MGFSPVAMRLLLHRHFSEGYVQDDVVWGRCTLRNAEFSEGVF